MNEQVAKLLIRHVLSTAGGLLAARGIMIQDGDAELIAGGLATALAVAWSAWEKRQKNKETTHNATPPTSAAGGAAPPTQT